MMRLRRLNRERGVDQCDCGGHTSRRSESASRLVGEHAAEGPADQSEIALRTQPDDLLCIVAGEPLDIGGGIVAQSNETVDGERAAQGPDQRIVDADTAAHCMEDEDWRTISRPQQP